MSTSDYSSVHSRILRTGQYKLETNRYVVKAPTGFKRTKQQEIDESEKRIEDLREEIKKLEDDIIVKSEKSAKEAEEIINKADLEAERIVQEAEKSAFNRVNKSLEDKDKVIEEIKQESDVIIAEARREAERIIKEARDQTVGILEEAREKGYSDGLEKGYQEGKVEVVSIVERLKGIIYTTIQEREKILVHSEKQIMNLVLTMVRKIIKKMTEEQKEIVLNNVQSALEIIRGVMKVYIHVNPEDYQFTLSHKDELIKMIEGMPEVKFFENPTIERGGVFIETDIGDVDATIASQLEEIENKIKFFVPVSVKTKGIDKAPEAEKVTVVANAAQSG